MEIFASILIVAAVVLPVLAVLAIVGFVGLLAYSWVKDLRTERAPEPVAEPQPHPATVRPRATAPAA